MQEPTKYDSIFWIETEKIHPNPYQPRHDFDEARLKALAESIRQYGILQPLVVTRIEHTKLDGGISSEYELIAGERRLRASKLAGLTQVPAVIRAVKEDSRVKLELAIIENLQREDLNAIDRAKALAQLAKEFDISHTEIGVKVGRSREYVSNSIRLLQLPEEIQQAVVGKEITEGHARALLMLTDRPEERDTVFRDIVLRKTSVRITEQLVRRIATDKIRKKNKTPEMMNLEKSLTETLGTRVIIENRTNGGRLLIEFFSPEDLTHIAELFAANERAEAEKSIPQVAIIEDRADAAIPNAFTLNTDSNEEVEGIPQASVNAAIPNAVRLDTEEGEEVEAPQSQMAVDAAIPNAFTLNTDSNEEVEGTPQASVNAAIPNAVRLDTEEGEEVEVPQSQMAARSQDDTPEPDDLYSIRDFTV